MTKVVLSAMMQINGSRMLTDQWVAHADKQIELALFTTYRLEL